MEKDVISIQCDEMTKSIMDEIQSDMIDSLSKISNNVNEETIEKLKNIDKKIFEIKNNLEDSNEEFEEKLDELQENIKEIKKEIEKTTENSIKNCVNEEFTKKFEEISKILDNTEKIQKNVEDVDKNIQNNVKSTKEDILKAVNDINIVEVKNDIDNIVKEFDRKIDNINYDFIEEKLAVLGIKVLKDASKNTSSIIERIDESNNNDVLVAKINLLTKKIDSRDKMIEEMSENQKILMDKIEEIQKEVEWKNKPLFIRSFNKKS